MPAPGPNYPSPSTVRRHSHQAKLESMFSLIGESMAKHNVLLGDVVSGLGKIADNTKEKESDRDELERLRRQNEERQREPKELPQPKPAPKETGRDSNNLAHLLSGFFMGGMQSWLTGALPSALGSIGSKLAGGMLAMAVAGPASDFISTLVGRGIGEAFGNDALGNQIAGVMQPNIEAGIIVGMFNKKAGLMTAIVGSALDGLTEAIGTDKLNLFGFDVDLNSSVMKGVGTALSMALFSATGRQLIMSVGRKLMGALLGPVGLVATIGSIAWGIIDKHNQEWIDELAGKAAKDLEGGLSRVRNERERTFWENLTGGGPDNPVMDSLMKLDRLGTDLNKKVGGNRDDSRSWDGTLQAAMVPAIRREDLTDAEDIASYDTTRSTLTAITENNEDNDLQNVPLDILRDVLKLTNRFDVENDHIEELVREMTAKRADGNQTYSEFLNKPANEPAPSRTAFEPLVGPNDDHVTAFDKIAESIRLAQDRNQDNAYSSMARLPKDLWLGEPSKLESDVLESMKDLDGSVFNYTPVITNQSNPVVRQGDTITQVTNNYHGRDASDDLRSYPHMIMGY